MFVCNCLLVILLLFHFHFHFGKTVVVNSNALTSSALVNDFGSAKDTCVPAKIEVKMCSNIRYNITTKHLPGYDSQTEVESVLNNFKELITVPCAPYLELFVCAMHLPICSEYSNLLVKVCKEFCIKIKSNCESFLKKAGHQWPPSLSCDTLPNHLDDRNTPNGAICLQPTDIEFNDGLEISRRKMAEFTKTYQPNVQIFTPTKKVSGEPKSPNRKSGSDSQFATRRHCSAAEVKLGPDANASCAKLCDADFFFYKDDKNFASVWMLVWSIICLASTCLAIATFFTDSSRFRFPERPIVWISICYLLYSIGHILRYALGPSIACSQIDTDRGKIDYRIEKDAGQWCALVFLILYFSSMAGTIWWVILTVCWYLCAAKKWAHEALNEKSVILHVIAWGIPMLKSVILLILHRIEGDELTHLCEVDSSNKTNLLMFIIIPLAVYLSIGIAFLVYALCSTMTVRDNLKIDGNSNFRRLEKLMTKISLFSFLYVIPSLCVLAFYIYVYCLKDSWNASLEQVLSDPTCVTEQGIRHNRIQCTLPSKPSSAFFMLKIFMSLAIGLPSGLFVWFNTKSLYSWRICICQTILRKSVKKTPSYTNSYAPVNSMQYQDSSQRQNKRLTQDSSIGPGSSHGKYIPTTITSVSNV